jgi:Uncharacterised nucleotidyltransferase
VSDAPAPSSVPLADIVDEGRRIAEEAERARVPLRLMGGVAIRLHGQIDLPPVLVRAYGDIDLVTTSRAGRDARRLLEALGYTPNERFNALNGSQRLVFYDEPHRRQIDVFVGEFSMCHEIPIADRLELERTTLPLAELLLTKLQIVELNPKDVTDMLALLVEHDVGESDGDTINAGYVASLLGRDWGLWRTATGSLVTLRASLAESGLSAEEQARVGDRLDRLEQRIEAEPRSMRWRTRARVGDRVRWYQEPDEVAHRAKDD